MIGYTGEITDLFDAYAGNTADLITHGCTRTDIFLPFPTFLSNFPNRKNETKQINRVKSCPLAHRYHSQPRHGQRTLMRRRVLAKLWPCDLEATH